MSAPLPKSCPFCDSTNLKNLRNGQGDTHPKNDYDDEELLVCMENDMYDGPVDLIKCDNGHHFYVPNHLANDDPYIATL